MGHRFSRFSTTVFVFLAVASVSETAAAESERLEPGDVFNLESVTDPQISPNGKQIIYVRQFADIMTDKR